EATVVTLEEVLEPDAHVGAVGTGPRAGKRLIVRTMETESAIIGPQRPRDETLGLTRLHLEPRIGAHPQSQVSSAEVAVAVALLVAVGGQAKPHMIVDPVVALAAASERIQLVETWRVLISHDEVGLATGQTTVPYEHLVARG